MASFLSSIDNMDSPTSGNRQEKDQELLNDLKVVLTDLTSVSNINRTEKNVRVSRTRI